MKRVNDISENQVENILAKISQTRILKLPGPDDQIPELFDLVRLMKDQIDTAAETMNTLTMTVLKSSVEMLNLLLDDYDKYVDANNLAELINDEVQLRYAHMESRDLNGWFLGYMITSYVFIGLGQFMHRFKQEIGDIQSVTKLADLQLSPEVHDSLKTVIQVAMAADYMMSSLGARATEAVCQAVRTALEEILERLTITEATGILKDVPMGNKVKSGKSVVEYNLFID